MPPEMEAQSLNQLTVREVPTLLLKILFALYFGGALWKQCQTLFFLGSKITADSDCSHEIKKTFTPWKESYDQPR